MKKTYTTPAGNYYNLYADMLAQTHLLIAGATGSGKSVVINGILATALYKAPTEVQFVLIDPKRVELVAYRDLPHTLKYACNIDDMVAALQYAVDVMEARYIDMQKRRIKKYDGSHVYVIIDELADLMTTVKKQAEPLIQRLGQVGRAAGVHLIAATQCPLSTIINTAIKVNIDSRVGLRTRCAQDSRNILGTNGCETLPRYGEAYYMKPEGTKLKKVPMVEEAEIDRLINHWMSQTKPTRKGLFGRLFA